MDLSCKRNTEMEQQDEPTPMEIETDRPPVETSQSSRVNMNEQTNIEEEMRTNEKQETLAPEIERNEMSPKNENTDGGKIEGDNNTEKGDNIDESDTIEKSDQTEDIGKTEKSDNKCGKTEESDKMNESDKTEESDKMKESGKNEENYKTDKIEESDKMKESDKKNEHDQPEESDKTEGSDKAEGSDKTKQYVTNVGDSESKQKNVEEVDECESMDLKDGIASETDTNVGRDDSRLENVDPSKHLSEENGTQEKQEECIQKKDEADAGDGNIVVEEMKDSPENEEIRTEEMVTNGNEENETKEVVKEMEEVGEEEEVEEQEESLSMPPDNLFEYQWPPDRMGEWYFVQEQICEYLGVTSFKRKYPDLERRVMEMKEKEFLRERGVVTEEQVTLGLTALKSEDVYDLMAKDYNKKYTDYLKVLQDKERQNISNKHKEYEAPTMDTEKVKEYTQRAVKQAAEYNASLMRERRDERQYFLDMQTMVVQVSKNRVKQTKKERTKVDGYPVALIPGQFQNFYRKYTPEELNYLPLQTALYGPVALQDQRRLGRPGWEDEDEPVSDISEPGSPDPKSTLPTNNIPPPPISMVQLETPQKDQHQLMMSQGTYKPKEINDAICGLCVKDKSCNKFNIPEELIHCAQCDNSGHPSCLEMNDDLVNVIKTYPWQCMECKTCFCCGQPTDEDKMMFCDDCDRGYHTFCVGLQEIPTGKWACPSCLAAQAKEKEIAAAAILVAAAAAATPTPEPVLVSTPTATPPPSKRRRSTKKRELVS